MQVDLRKLPLGSHVGLGILVECPRCHKPSVRKRTAKTDKYIHTLRIEPKALKPTAEADERQGLLFGASTMHPTTEESPSSMRQVVVSECVIKLGFQWESAHDTLHECKMEDGWVLTVKCARDGSNARWFLEAPDGRREDGNGAELFDARRRAQKAYGAMR